MTCARLFLPVLLCGANLSLCSAAHAQAWIDVKTGQRVNSAPIVGGTSELQGKNRLVVAAPSIGDPTRAYDPVTGRNFAFDKERCTWIDVKTGQAIGSAPIVGGSADLQANGRMIGAYPEVADAKRAFDGASGRNFVFDADQCKRKPAKAIPPPPPATPPTSQFYVGVGGSYFFEPDTQIGLVTATLGYRLTPHVGIEVQGDVGVTKEKFDNGSTFRSSTGIDWSLYPTLAGYLPIGGNADLFVHGGYGLTRFGSKATVFSGSSSTTFDDHNTVGTGILGGGAEIGLGGSSSVRLQYDRLFFDNGSEGNRLALSFMHRFGAAPALPPPPPPPAPAPPPPPQ